ncbi:hypothetical protein ACFPYJ_08515 [Paenibacillus solisilvae]|uniref:Uncharacterized protein n=1 Tax=Paenibacillus solisilvae TaxID=2486751 RepID=A0ABW0VW06_9BACL
MNNGQRMDRRSNSVVQTKVEPLELFWRLDSYVKKFLSTNAKKVDSVHGAEKELPDYYGASLQTRNVKELVLKRFRGNAAHSSRPGQIHE